MITEKMNLDDFVQAAISDESKASIVGGLDIRPYLDRPDLYEVRIFGQGPYATYIDGVKESDNDTW